MDHFHYSERDPETVTAYGSTGTTVRAFISKEQAPRFMMRRFEIAPGGTIGVHGHPEEHEIYVLEGELVLVGNSGIEVTVKRDEFVYVPPGEEHGYRNDGTGPAAFICVIPKLEG